MPVVFNPFTGNLDLVNTGDITGVTAGTGLSGGGTSGGVTLNLANTAVSAGSYTYTALTVDAQGRITSAANATVSATDKLLGRASSGAGAVEEIACTAAGRALLDDADASAQRTTLGLGSLATASTVTDAEISASAEIAVSKLADGSARQLLQTDAAGTGVEWASNIDVPGTLDVTQAATFDSTVSVPLGAVGTPSIYPGSDSNTGLWSPAADTLAVSTNGVERVRVNATETKITNDLNINDGGSFTTTLQVVSPTANRTISLPNLTGTVGLVAGANQEVAYNNAGAMAGISTLKYDGTILTTSGRFVNSYNAGASAPAKAFTGTWFTGGTATTTKPQVLIEPSAATSTGWSTSGTALGVNADSATFAGLLLDLQANASTRFSVSGLGVATIGSSASTGAARTTTAPARLYVGTGTWTDNSTAASGTASHGTIVAFDNPAIAASNSSVTYTNASTVYIDGAPTNGTNVTITNAFALFVAAGASRFGGSVLSSNATAGLGYVTGAGGAVTQATDRTTGVTINNVCGAITLVSAAGSTSWQTFTVTNSAVAATDVVKVCQKSGTDLYMIHVTNVAAGSFKITYATTGGTTTEQPVFNFAVIKAAAA